MNQESIKYGLSPYRKHRETIEDITVSGVLALVAISLVFIFAFNY